MDDGNSTTTRLLTLLNVSAIKAGKRKRSYNDDEFQPSVKLNRRKPVQSEPLEKENENEENAQDAETDGQENEENISAEGAAYFIYLWQVR
jgi:U3 small nucleolar RNA-associated protein 25